MKEPGIQMVSCDDTASGGRPVRVDRWDRQGSNRPMEAVGDECAFKLSTSLRLMTQNINGLGLIAENIKELAVKELLINKKIDVMGIQETNVCWHKMQNKHKIWDRFRAWKESGSCKVSVAYNTSDTISAKSQYGGTSLITMNMLAHRHLDSGVDETHLGRWAWTRYRGK